MNKINLAEIPLAMARSPKGRYRPDQSGYFAGADGSEWPGEERTEAAVRGRTGSCSSGSGQLAVSLAFGAVGNVSDSFRPWTSAHACRYFSVAGRGFLIHSPGEAHQITNTGATDLVYYIIADDPPSDVCHYPDTGKWSLPGQPNPVRISESSYYEGEE